MTNQCQGPNVLGLPRMQRSLAGGYQGSPGSCGTPLFENSTRQLATTTNRKSRWPYPPLIIVEQYILDRRTVLYLLSPAIKTVFATEK